MNNASLSLSNDTSWQQLEETIVSIGETRQSHATKTTEGIRVNALGWSKF